MEFIARGGFDPGLHAKLLVPNDALKEGINQAHNHGRGQQLRVKARPLGNAARDDGRDGGCKGQQKEKLDQLVAVLGGQLLGPHKKVGAVGHPVADQKINHGGH